MYVYIAPVPGTLFRRALYNYYSTICRLHEQSINPINQSSLFTTYTGIIPYLHIKWHY